MTDRCDQTDLHVTACAHCQGHALPVGIEPEPVRGALARGRRIWPPREAQHEQPAGQVIALPATWAPFDTDGECRCGKPTRPTFTLCDDCGDLLSRALGEVSWLDEQLTTTIGRERAIPTEGSAAGAEKPLPWHEKAAEIKRTLHGLLVMWVRFCDEESVPHQSPSNDLPEDRLPSLSAWLLWRVDGLSRRDIAPEAVDEITDAVAAAHSVIDKRPDRWYAGPCNNGECSADLYATKRQGDVKCRDCAATYDVGERREWLLAEAEDRLATAAELARAVSWLGAEPLTAARVRKWAERERIIAKGHDGARPLYRIGDAIDLLAGDTRRGEKAG